MTRRGSLVFVVGTTALLLCAAASGQMAADLPILTGAQPGKGFFIGLNTSSNRIDWLTSEGAADLLMQYPAGQLWGSVFITVGTAVATNRPGVDVSAYQSLVLEMRGDAGTTVAVGIKDAVQPDDGSETTVLLQVSGDWQTYSIPLTKFSGVNLTKVYLATEFVFSGAQAQALRVRNIKFSAEPAVTTKILPQFVFGGGWYSALLFTNTGGTAASIQLNFVGDDGKPISVPSVGSSLAVNLAPRGSIRIEAPNAGNLTQGYVLALLPDGVTGYAVFRQSGQGIPDQEAVVPLSGSSATRCTLIWDDTVPLTAVAMVNPSAVDVTVAITIRGRDGNTIGTSSVGLPAKTKSTAVLRALPGLAAMTGNWGAADFDVSSGNIAVLGLRFGGQAFTSIPTTDK